MAMEYGSPAGTLDLHMHSVYSDGSETVEGLIAAAQGMRLAGIAVTDHDCLRQLSSIRAAARGAAVPVLAGVEVSAMDPATGHKLHVLAYGLEATPATARLSVWWTPRFSPARSCRCGRRGPLCAPVRRLTVASYR